MKLFFSVSLALALSVSMFIARAAQPPSRAAGLTIAQLIDIRHPSSPMWTPDGRGVVFVWDRAGVSKIYIADASGPPSSGQAREPRELRDAGGQLGGAFWSTDGRALMIAKNADLWRVPIDGSPASPVWTTPAPESGIVPSPDGTRVAFVRPSSAGGSA